MKSITAPNGWLVTVKASGEASRIPFDPETSLEQLQSAVAGYIELVTMRGSLRRFDCFCNDEGKIHGLPVNEVISAMYGRDRICGDVVICNHDATGDTTGLTDSEAEVVLAELEANGAAIAGEM